MHVQGTGREHASGARLRVVLMHGVFRAARLVRIEPDGPPQREVYREDSVRVEKMLAE